ncbi:MAG: methyltransferase domain-containing protein [Clostridia bacterium]|nr:methyltransferase domain-containing protein [Clostridia bacterium]
MEHFICPVCGENLILGDKVYECINHHTYNLAKSGYVNLLRSQRSSEKRHGDDKMMIRARSAFLEKGHYAPLLEGIVAECDRLQVKMLHLTDIGCGEGWYTDKIFTHLRENGHIVQIEGIDISKDAVSAAAKRNPYIAAAVASVACLPIKSESCDMLLNLFAPFDVGEFARILKSGGIWLKAIPLERHLYGLKAAIYDNPYENKVAVEQYEGFELVRRTDIRDKLTLRGEDISNLFRMTPYFYKTSAADQQKLENAEVLETEIEFAILIYQKKSFHHRETTK